MFELIKSTTTHIESTMVNIDEFNRVMDDYRDTTEKLANVKSAMNAAWESLVDKDAEAQVNKQLEEMMAEQAAKAGGAAVAAGGGAAATAAAVPSMVPAKLPERAAGPATRAKAAAEAVPA